tara:strand:+ start:384 stop:1022 length:639 start_codon:yes stop_codon:yes gene_type:complete
MSKLYYGNGSVSIDSGGTEIRGLEITYRGKITIFDQTSDNFAIIANNNRIIIFPSGEGSLSDLFKYVGEIKIMSVIVADNNAKKVPTTIHRVMDYAELLASNAEDMTEIVSEDLKAGYLQRYKVKQTAINKKIIPNLNTSSHDGDLYLGSKIYTGDFHVHIDTNTPMTGGTHTEDSQHLNTIIKTTKKRKKQRIRRRNLGNKRKMRSSNAKY